MNIAPFGVAVTASTVFLLQIVEKAVELSVIKEGLSQLNYNFPMFPSRRETNVLDQSLSPLSRCLVSPFFFTHCHCTFLVFILDLLLLTRMSFSSVVDSLLHSCYQMYWGHSCYHKNVLVFIYLFVNILIYLLFGIQMFVLQFVLVFIADERIIPYFCTLQHYGVCNNHQYSLLTFWATYVWHQPE